MARSGSLRVVRDQNAGPYLAGVLVSAFGSSAMALAAGVWTFSLTGSSSLAGLTAFFLWAPTLAGPAIGTLADRVRRRPLLVWIHVVMAAALPVLLAVRSRGTIWILFLVLLAYGISVVLADAAESGLVAHAVPEELRGDFNGLRLTINEGMKLLAPLAGAALFAVFGGPAVALLDAATFAVAAAMFAWMPVREPRPARPGGARWRQDTAEGVRLLWNRPVLRRLVLAGALTMLLAGFNGAAIYAVADAGLHRPPTFVGVLYALQGCGSVVSGLTAGPLLRRWPPQWYAAAGIMLFAVGAAARALPSAPVALAASVAIGAGLPAVLITALTAVQRLTPGAAVGRVTATANTLIFVPNAVTLAVGAALIAVVDHRLILAAIGAAGIAAALFCLTAREPRETRDDDEPAKRS